MGVPPQLEVVVERPVCDLTIFKVHFGKLTVNLYSKGERVLRVEVVAHNTIDLRCGRGINQIFHITASLNSIVERLLLVLRDNVLTSLLAGAGNEKTGRITRSQSPVDVHYHNIQSEIQNIYS